MKFGEVAVFQNNVLSLRGHPKVPLPDLIKAITINVGTRTSTSGNANVAFNKLQPYAGHSCSFNMNDVPGNCGEIHFFSLPGGDPWGVEGWKDSEDTIAAVAAVCANITIYGGYSIAQISIDGKYKHIWEKYLWKEFAAIPSARERHGRKLHYMYFNAKEFPK